MRVHQKRATLILLLGMCLTSCSVLQTGAGNLPNSESTLEATGSAASTVTPTPFQPQMTRIYTGLGVPDGWKAALFQLEGFVPADDPDDAEVNFSLITEDQKTQPEKVFTRVYAAVAPFYTVQDGFTTQELQELWRGQGSSGSFHGVLCSEETAQILKGKLGEPGPGVSVTQKVDFPDMLSQQTGSFGIVPFEELTPSMKVLKIDGLSPLDKPLDQSRYFLQFNFGLDIADSLDNSLKQRLNEISNTIPNTNRDETLMTVVVMSGTTAITRGTAAKVVIKGADYPIEAVKDWFLSADLRHVSNEISFAQDCPDPDPFSSSLRFCAQPEAIAVLEKLGINVVELTGNHENDFGTENFRYTLDLYNKRGWATFGGGLDPESARRPALLENNGNKIAFIGCNPVGPANAWVKDNSPGVAKCDYEFLYSTITNLKKQGYVVITSYQFDEIYQFMYAEEYRSTFREAARAGADIVQGSQAHFPMGFEIIDNHLIHYGLGNFLFDQMDYPVEGTRREYVDRHIIYNGKYINTELLTALLTDWSRPVPMNQSEREQFLSDLFSASLKR